jgi:hypothetical protein
LDSSLKYVPPRLVTSLSTPSRVSALFCTLEKELVMLDLTADAPDFTALSIPVFGFDPSEWIDRVAIRLGAGPPAVPLRACAVQPEENPGSYFGTYPHRTHFV